MPLRYSRVSLKDINAEYSRAYARLSEMIGAESQAHLGETHQKLSPEDRIIAHEIQEPGEAFFGSIRVPSQPILRGIVGSLHADVDQADPGLGIMPRIVALTSLIVVVLGLFNGLRPFEVTRLKVRSFDLESCSVAVKGKASWGKQVYRYLPIISGVVNLIEELLTLRGEDLTPGKRIFSFHEKGLERPALSMKDLDQILESTAMAAGWTANPVFYGLRHRFRTDMLSSGMDEPNINYLMGHEIIGQETYSIYSEQHYESLREQYLIAAGEMVHRYGFL
jgi:integrase